MLLVRFSSIAAASIILCSLPPPALAEGMTHVETFGDWQVLADSKSPHAFCFVTSQPKSGEPQSAAGTTHRAYISAWPKDGIKGEVSFLVGVRTKKQSEGIAKINANGYRLFGSGDRVFVKDSTQELKLVEAMKKGDSLSVEITSDSGTTLSDKYSLSGIGQALQKMQQTCF